MAAALIVLTANVPDMWTGENLWGRASHGLLIAGALFIMYHLYFRAGARHGQVQQANALEEQIP